MSMYNLVHGTNAAADWLLGLLDLTREDVGRFRDAWVTEDDEIAVYTRNGGGNREHWDDAREPGDECSCTGCVIEHRLPLHPLYLRDEDDEFDSTYATVYFRCPEQALTLVRGLREKRDPDERWLTALEELRTGKRPDIMEALRPLCDAIEKALK